MALPIAQEVFAKSAFALEAQPFVEGDRRRVVIKDGEADAVQVKLVEGKVQEKAHRFASIALSTVRFLAHTNGDKTGTVRPGNAIQLQQADDAVGIHQANGKEEGVRILLPFLQSLGKLLFTERGGRLTVIEAQESGVLVPLRYRLHILFANSVQLHLFTAEQLFALHLRFAQLSFVPLSSRLSATAMRPPTTDAKRLTRSLFSQDQPRRGRVWCPHLCILRSVSFLQ